MHHWAALLFVGGLMVHTLRVFFTGAYRKPRELNWLIGVLLFTLALVEGLTGYSLPDDLLSGAGLRITQGVMLSCRWSARSSRSSSSAASTRARTWSRGSTRSTSCSSRASCWRSSPLTWS